jgi:hypothetical protein
MAPELLKVLLACGRDTDVDVAHHQLQSILGLSGASHLELVNELACSQGSIMYEQQVSGHLSVHALLRDSLHT